MASLRSFSGLAVVAAIVVFAGPGARADEGDGRSGLERLVTDHTLIYRDKNTGLENILYFGRFGNFDRYVPCTETYGTWRVAADGSLCLKEGEGPPKQVCFKVSKSGDRVSLSSPNGATIHTAKLLRGNRMPIG